MNRAVGLFLTFCVAAPLALYFYFVGAAPYGNGWPGGSSEPCLQPQALPRGAQVVERDPSDDAAMIEYTRLPLGIVCTVQLAVPARVEVIRHQSWPLTIAWLGFSLIADSAVGTAIFLVLRRYGRRARSRSSIPEIEAVIGGPRPPKQAGALEPRD